MHAENSTPDVEELSEKVSFDFGFSPSTLAEDGDPLDILVLMDAPAHVGCLIEVRIIGIINAKQSEDGKTEKDLLLRPDDFIIVPSRLINF